MNLFTSNGLCLVAQSCPTLCDPMDLTFPYGALSPEEPRFLCPWNSPGKNTGVGCHFLLQPKDWCDGNMICWCAAVHLFLVLWSLVSCWELETSHGGSMCVFNHCSPPGSLVHGIFQARILEWVAISSSRESSWLRDQTRVSWVSCTGRRILYHCTT